MAANMTRGTAWTILTMNTLAFTVCFAVWMMNGVLVTYLVANGIYDWSRTEMAILIAAPVLTGSVLRLPAGLMTDRYGGRIVFSGLMLVSALACAAMWFVDSYMGFLLCSLGFGLAGASFSVGIAYTSACFGPERQGTVLGIFGAGNAGAAVTTLAAPGLLLWLTAGDNTEGWRWLPVAYGIALVGMTLAYWPLTTTVRGAGKATLASQLRPLRDIRVWRFGLYYFLVFGVFVALSQWLVPYYVQAYALTLGMAGLFASIFSLPSGVIRALCGWITDKIGARASLYWTFGLCAVLSLLLCFPEMVIRTPGEGVISRGHGVVVSISETEMVVRNPKTGAETPYSIKARPEGAEEPSDPNVLIPLPKVQSWMTWAGVMDESGVIVRPFEPGDKVQPRQLLARGTTNVYFQANVYIFTAIVLLLGLAMGLGKAAVFKHIPVYFPGHVGAVGGIVGVIGGLGGFFCPILFGIMLDATGIWTTSWMFIFVLSVACLFWMHIVVRRINREAAPEVAGRMELAPKVD